MVVVLDVGGVTYTTSIEILRSRPDTMFFAMFNHEWSDDDRFIDRDGSIFQYVLTYLRDGVISLHHDIHMLIRLKREFELYCI